MLKIVVGRWLLYAILPDDRRIYGVERLFDSPQFENFELVEPANTGPSLGKNPNGRNRRVAELTHCWQDHQSRIRAQIKAPDTCRNAGARLAHSFSRVSRNVGADTICPSLTMSIETSTSSPILL